MAIIGGVSAIRHGPQKHLGWAAVGIAVAEAMLMVGWAFYDGYRAGAAG